MTRLTEQQGDLKELEESEHDKLILWLMRNPEKLPRHFYPDAAKIETDITIEPVLREEYKPDAYPDAMIRFKAFLDHTNPDFRTIAWDRESYHKHFYLKCSENCRREELCETSRLLGYDCGEEEARLAAHELLNITKDWDWWKAFCPQPMGLLIIEVKPRIISFGATIRQLGLYNRRISHNTDAIRETCLLSNDPRFDSQFKSQGFTVFHPENLENYK